MPETATERERDEEKVLQVFYIFPLLLFSMLWGKLEESVAKITVQSFVPAEKVRERKRDNFCDSVNWGSCHVYTMRSCTTEHDNAMCNIGDKKKEEKEAHNKCFEGNF